jgi:hypothetical protein
MEVLIPILGTIGFFGAIITWVYMKYKSRHQERMALIESGTSADIFTEKTMDNKSSALKWGMLLTGAGLGFYVGILTEIWFGIEDGLGALPLTFVGGGLGLILFYRIMLNAHED